MATNKGFKLQVKNKLNSYSTLYPKTTKEQVIGWNIGEIYGPYDITLKANDWDNKTQEIKLDGVSGKDIVNCQIVLSSDEIIARKQKEAYSLIFTQFGLISYENKLKFSCKQEPKTDIDVQVWWTR